MRIGDTFSFMSRSDESHIFGIGGNGCRSIWLSYKLVLRWNVEKKTTETFHRYSLPGAMTIFFSIDQKYMVEWLTWSILLLHTSHIKYFPQTDRCLSCRALGFVSWVVSAWHTYYVSHQSQHVPSGSSEETKMRRKTVIAVICIKQG